jgi:hypothetical protein
MHISTVIIIILLVVLVVFINFKNKIKAVTLKVMT